MVRAGCGLACLGISQGPVWLEEGEWRPELQLLRLEK